MSTLFNLRSQHKEKEISNHPWDKTIKGIYSNKIKYAHNSIRNPFYPKKDEKNKYPDEDCIKFTVIGDRVTKEFIYCVNLVKGMHKYRWKKFGIPIIKGKAFSYCWLLQAIVGLANLHLKALTNMKPRSLKISTVEWPDVWRSLKIEYGGLAYCLQSRVAVLVNENLLGGELELKKLIETKYIYHLQLDYYNEAVSYFATYIRSSGRPCVYMHISIDGEHIGTMIFMLFSDILPYTCDNFLHRCNDTKGGYSGTPIHRIVKDGWIQCGGFGLKSVDLDCENFIIPHDRRGVLCMANDGRHIDCSTQFFVLLQPAPWMARRYVAFGQLIEGEATLDKIEKVPTWYESPTSEIVIFKAGIFNMECHDIAINKNTNEYIHGHIEDLIVLGDLLIESLIQRVFLIVEIFDETEEVGEEADETGNIHATERFLRKKDEIERHIQNQNQQVLTQPVKRTVKTPESHKGEHENNDFDVDEYQMEEATPYQYMSVVSASLVVKPKTPFYMPLTDVPYPGEVESTYDLKKFLKGDYCLESDLDKDAHRKAGPPKQHPPEIFDVNYGVSQSESLQSLDSVDEREIRHYLRANVDHVSFAGGIVRSIAQGLGPYNLLDKNRKKVLIAGTDKVHAKIKRRHTGFISPEDLAKVLISHKPIIDDQDDNDSDNDDNDAQSCENETPLYTPLHASRFYNRNKITTKLLKSSRKVRLATSKIHDTSNSYQRRLTGFVRMMNIDESDTDVCAVAHDHRHNLHDHRHISHTQRPSAMQRLYDEIACDDKSAPTLKEYKPLSEAQHKSLMLTFLPNSRIRSNHCNSKIFQRHSIDHEPFLENIMNLQHDKKLARNVSSDYVKTIDQIEHRLETSIRTSEYAKARPSMTVSAYQLKNQKYQEDLKKTFQVIKACQATDAYGSMKSARGIRLPGDTPLDSFISMV